MQVDSLLTVADAARMLSVSTRTIKRWCQPGGKLFRLVHDIGDNPSRRVIRFRSVDLEHFLTSRRTPTAAPAGTPTAFPKDWVEY